MEHRHEKKRRLTAAEVEARGERLRAAGLRPRTEKTSVLTTLRTAAPVDDPGEARQRA